MRRPSIADEKTTGAYDKKSNFFAIYCIYRSTIFPGLMPGLWRTLSHLFIMRIIPFFAFIATPTRCSSWWDIPSKASITTATTSARSIARSDRKTDHCSIFRVPIFPARRIPAVSMRQIFLPSCSMIVSIESRVVPGISFTTARVSPAIAFTSEDFPTFGRPINAIFKRLSS